MPDRTGLLDPLFGDPVIDTIFANRATLQRMLDAEAALARAEERLGIIPAGSATAIAACCRAELYDIGQLAHDTAMAGTPVIPLAKALTALVEQQDAAAAAFAHWGATSQDIIDTGLMLQSRDAFDHIDVQLGTLAARLDTLADQHRASLMPGRTLLQHAVPTVFGLKAAGWLSAVTRHRQRIKEARPRVLALQFGGAASTLASLGDRGSDAARELASELNLSLPDMPWHTARDRIGEIACLLGLIAGTVAKIGKDISLLMASETAEAFEPAAPGKGGSSAMPQKRNPVAANVMIAAGLRAPGLIASILAGQAQEHERAAGLWHAEWLMVPELFCVTGGALRACVETIAGLEIDTARMRANLDLSGGRMLAERVSLALAPALGRRQAAAAVEAAAKASVARQLPFREALLAQPDIIKSLSTATLTALLDPAGYLGSADAFIGAARAAHAEFEQRKG